MDISSRYSNYTPKEVPIVTRIITKVSAELLNPLIVLLFAIAIIVFLWGVYGFIRGADDAEARKDGAQHMLWGILGFVIMVAAYGIIHIILNTFGIPIPASFF